MHAWTNCLKYNISKLPLLGLLLIAVVVVTANQQQQQTVWNTPGASLAEDISLVDSAIRALQFGKSVGPIYEAWSNLPTQPGFPLEIYPQEAVISLPREAIACVIQLIRREQELTTHWNKQQILEHIQHTKFDYANEQVQETIQDARALHASAECAITKMNQINNCHKRSCVHPYFGYASAIVIGLACILFRRCMLQALGLSLVCVAVLYLLHSNTCRPTLAAEFESDAARLEQLTRAYNLSAMLDKLGWIALSLETTQEFNETVTTELIRFSEKLANVTSAIIGDTDPDNMLVVLHESQNDLQQTQAQLRSVEATYLQNGNTERVLQIHKIGDDIDKFVRFFNKIEEDLYVTMQTGVAVNQLTTEYLTDMSGHIQSRKFSLCIHVLTSLEAEQRKQMIKLNSSAEFITRAADTIKLVQYEARSLSGPLSEEQRTAWIKKLIANGALFTGAGIGTTAIVSSTVMGAATALPAAVAAAAVAAVSYQVKSYYQANELVAADAINLMMRLANATQVIDTRLTNYVRMMTLLVEDVRILIDNLKKAERRFQHIRIQPEFSDYEARMLNQGVERVVTTSRELTERYRSVIARIFRMIAEQQKQLH